MKLLTIVCLSTFITFLAQAQIVFQSSNLPVAPTVLYNGVDTLPTGVTPGPAGANQAYNFANVAQHIIDTVTHQTAAGSGYAGNFPTATNAITPDGTSYGFFRNTGTAFTGQGIAGDLLGNGGTVVVQFSPTFDLYRFPTQFGGVFGGTYGFQQTASGASVGQPVDQVRITFSSVYTDTIDGYGTVATPVGAYNGLRQKRVERTDTHIEFKLFSFSSWATADRIFDTVVTYTYLAIESKGPLVTLGLNDQGVVNRVTYSLTPPAPVANFTYNNPYGGLVQFINQSVNSPTTYAWTFGDGGTSSAQNPTHTYATNGTYNVCLTVTNVSGTNTYCQNVVVTGHFNTSISGPGSACANAASALNFSTPGGTNHTYTWTATGGIITSGAGTTGVTVNFNGSAPYSLQLVECDQTGNYCKTANRTVTILQAATSTLNETICQGQSFLGYTSTGTYRDTFVAANTCDSIRTLNLTVLPNAVNTLSATICFGDTMFGYFASGTYRDTFIAANTCDSVRVFNLTVRTQNLVTISPSICAGDTLEGYFATGSYTDTFTDQYGCDSARVLNLTVRPANVTNINVSICPGNSYEGYTTAGVYNDNFTDRFGCDSSRTVNLTVQANIIDTLVREECFGGSYFGYTSGGVYADTFNSVGCDSIRVLFLTILPQSLQTVSQTICQGDTFEGYSASGSFVNQFTNSRGCDSTRTLNLTVLPNSSTTIDTTICYNTMFEGYTATGVYYDTLSAANGCDSVRIIDLTVLPQNSITLNQAICPGDTFMGFSATGMYAILDVDANGCDSTTIVNLTVLPAIATTIDTTICFGSQFEGYSATGNYYDTLVAANTCDSVRIINLTVLNDNVVTLNETICQGDNFEGYTTNGTYTNTLTGANGCDSTRILNLTVLAPVTTSSFDTVCKGQSVMGYNQTGVYVINGVAANGCDSVHTLNLTVTPAGVKSNNRSICTGDSIFLAGGWQNTAGTYTDTLLNAGCEEIITTILTVNMLPTVPSITAIDDTLTATGGTYTNYYWYKDGVLLDSTSGASFVATGSGDYTVMVTNANGCTATSEVFNLLISGVTDAIALKGLRVYPNPTTGMLTVSVGNPTVMNVMLYNALGQLITQVQPTQSNHLVLDISEQTPGVYLMQIVANDATHMQRVVLTR